MPEIALCLVEHGADVIVLSEYRTTIGGQIRGVLAEHGWTHQICTNPKAHKNGILVVSRLEIEACEHSESAPSRRERWLEFRVPQVDLRVAGVHIPDGGGPNGKSYFWKDLLAVAREHKDERYAVIGDFNTGRHYVDEAGRTFTCTVQMGRLTSMGFRDAWRWVHPAGREYSWYSHTGNGFRIDHAFVSEGLGDRIESAWYSHSEREAGLSDHSPMVLTLNL